MENLTVESQIRFKDSDQVETVTFGIGEWDEKTNDDHIFYWIDSEDSLKNILEGKEEFLILDDDHENYILTYGSRHETAYTVFDSEISAMIAYYWKLKDPDNYSASISYVKHSTDYNTHSKLN